MALPTKELTWQYAVNMTASAGSEGLFTHRQNLFNIKSAMISFASSPWTVVSSSNGTTTSAGDNWTNTGSINWSNGGPRSWITFKQTGLSSTFQLLFVCSGDGYSDNGRLTVVVSEGAGFTGGNNTARPTATDENILVGPGSGGFPFATNAGQGAFQAVTHVQQSTDGSATRIFFMHNGFCPSWMNFQKASDTPAAWSAPNVYSARTTGNGGVTEITYTNYYSNPYTAARITGTNLGLYMSTESIVDNAIGEYFIVRNELDNSFPMTPIGLVNTINVGKRGRHGRLKDVWFGQISAPPAYTGTTYPEDGSRQFIQIGHMIFPWNGSVPLIG